MRAAKERKRIGRLNAPIGMPDMAHVSTSKPKMSGFRVTIKCYDDDQSVSFVSMRGPFGLTVSATAAAAKVAAIFSNYIPA